MSSKSVKQNTENAAPTLLPVFAAVALIISAAVYIVYKLTQQNAVNKWADYDECGI